MRSQYENGAQLDQTVRYDSFIGQFDQTLDAV